MPPCWFGVSVSRGGGLRMFPDGAALRVGPPRVLLNAEVNGKQPLRQEKAPLTRNSTKRRAKCATASALTVHITEQRISSRRT